MVLGQAKTLYILMLVVVLLLGINRASRRLVWCTSLKTKRKYLRAVMGWAQEIQNYKITRFTILSLKLLIFSRQVLFNHFKFFSNHQQVYCYFVPDGRIINFYVIFETCTDMLLVSHSCSLVSLIYSYHWIFDLTSL